MCQVEDTGIAALSRLTTITQLGLAGCVALTGRATALVAAHMPGLMSLRLGGCSRVATVSDACLLPLQHLTALTHLDLAGCLEISDSGSTHTMLLLFLPCFLPCSGPY